MTDYIPKTIYEVYGIDGESEAFGLESIKEMERIGLVVYVGRCDSPNGDVRHTYAIKVCCG